MTSFTSKWQYGMDIAFVQTTNTRITYLNIFCVSLSPSESLFRPLAWRVNLSHDNKVLIESSYFVWPSNEINPFESYQFATNHDDARMGKNGENESDKKRAYTHKLLIRSTRDSSENQYVQSIGVVFVENKGVCM